jgi:hypothetical protein
VTIVGGFDCKGVSKTAAEQYPSLDRVLKQLAEQLESWHTMVALSRGLQQSALALQQCHGLCEVKYQDKIVQ